MLVLFNRLSCSHHVVMLIPIIVFIIILILTLHLLLLLILLLSNSILILLKIHQFLLLEWDLRRIVAWEVSGRCV